MIYNFLSVYGIYYPSGTIETRAKWRIYCNERCMHKMIMRIQMFSKITIIL